MHYTVTETYQSENRIRGSKFIASVSSIKTQSDVERILNTVKTEHPTATHYCYAYLFNLYEPIQFVNDDGEPDGTAGLPILNVLKSFNLMNVMIVVVRYYGGRKLGKTGLIDAYSGTAKLAIDHAKTKQIIPITKIEVHFGYQHQSILDKLKSDYTLYELNSTYLEFIVLEIGIPVQVATEVIHKLRSFEYLFHKLEVTGESFYIEE
ncbi:MAG: YigZ family protein [Balneolaceae bacterium]